MDKLEAMHIYVRVAELASFTQAADSMGLPKASVSTIVKQLEAAVGVRLLHRTTRKVQMTQDGLAFYERARDLLSDIDDLENLFRQDAAELKGRLRVDMPSGVARNIVIPALPTFLAAHPQVSLELGSTDRRVDLVREGYDCVLRVGILQDSSLVARPIGHFRMVNCASPAYLALKGMPRKLNDLHEHVLVHYAPTLGMKASGWEYVHQGQKATQSMAGALTVNSAESYQAACLAGLGMIQVPEPGVRHLLRNGSLLEVMPEYLAEPMPVSLIYPNRRHLPRRVQVFMNWLESVVAPYVTKSS